jgi:hypothetical protein
MASFPEVTQVISETDRPDDGTDTAGFFNTEYFVDLKRKEQRRPLFHQNKEALIAAIDKQLSQFPGIIWNYSQPISDNMEEAVSGVKGAAQNSLRLIPLCLNSETRRSASARLRRRNAASTPFVFMPKLQHRSRNNGRMGLPECIHLMDVSFRLAPVRRAIAILTNALNLLLSSTWQIVDVRRCQMGGRSMKTIASDSG